jgi:hypothetical protein
MKHDTHTEQQLERAVDKLLKQQPLRKAPSDMYARVMREVQLRKVLPWWRKSFLHWPLMMQILFFVAAIGTAKGVLMLCAWLDMHAFATATSITESSSIVQSSSALFSVGNQLSMLLSRLVPATWVYGALMVVAAVYLVLFGIGFTTYKTLYTARAVAR